MSKFVSDCCEASILSDPENPSRGETVSFVCTECGEYCSPVSKEEDDE